MRSAFGSGLIVATSVRRSFDHEACFSAPVSILVGDTLLSEAGVVAWSSKDCKLDPI